MDTGKERSGVTEQYRISREREVRQISSQIDMMVRRARVMGQDCQADPSVQEVIARRDQIDRDLSALAKADSDQLVELRGRIDLQIDDLEKLFRTTRDAMRR